jgi:hypothetical protein
LIGRWFHSFHADGRTVIWQGQILGLTHGRYLVQLYEWVLGEPSTERLIPVADVAGWQFYPSAQAKNDWYENVYSPRREQERRSGASSA